MKYYEHFTTHASILHLPRALLRLRARPPARDEHGAREEHGGELHEVERGEAVLARLDAREALRELAVDARGREPEQRGTVVLVPG